MRLLFPVAHRSNRSERVHRSPILADKLRFRSPGVPSKPSD